MNDTSLYKSWKNNEQVYLIFFPLIHGEADSFLESVHVDIVVFTVTGSQPGQSLDHVGQNWTW